MGASYSKQQQVFCLNQIANSASGIKASQEELQEYATKTINAILSDRRIQALIGNWETVWGPVVFQHTHSNVADNTMFVAQNMDAEQTEYVVAIAGTNPISWYGWLVEDFTLIPPVAWPYDNASKAKKISQGTSIGVGHLQDMLSKGQTLNDFLKCAASGAAGALSLHFTGHSLGGALSPTLALTYKDQQGQLGYWDPSSKANISVLSTAGPTPGNDAFARHYDNQLGANTDRVWNNIDVVPHAWLIAALEEVPTLYTPYLEPNQAIDAVVSIAIGNSNLASSLDSVMTPICASTAGYPGEINTSLVTWEWLWKIIAVDLLNKLIDAIGKKLGWSQQAIDFLKMVVDYLINHRDEVEGDLTNLEANLAHCARTVANEEVQENLDIQGLLNMLSGLLLFLVQAAWQHVGSYPIYMETTEFNDIVGKITTKG